MKKMLVFHLLLMRNTWARMAKGGILWANDSVSIQNNSSGGRKYSKGL